MLELLPIFIIFHSTQSPAHYGVTQSASAGTGGTGRQPTGQPAGIGYMYGATAQSGPSVVGEQMGRRNRRAEGGGEGMDG